MKYHPSSVLVSYTTEKNRTTTNTMTCKEVLTDREREQLRRQQERREQQMRMVGRWLLFILFSIILCFHRTTKTERRE